MRSDTFTWAGQCVHQDETIFLVEVELFEACADGLVEGVERDSYDGCRWWSPEEIRASTERFAPRALGDLLATLDRHGPPAIPFVVGPAR